MMKLNLKWAAMAAAVFVMTAAASASAIVMLPGRSGDQPILHEKSFKACVLKGREKVDFARDFWNDKIVAEVQHVVGKPDSWYLHVQDMLRFMKCRRGPGSIWISGSLSMRRNIAV